VPDDPFKRDKALQELMDRAMKDFGALTPRRRKLPLDVIIALVIMCLVLIGGGVLAVKMLAPEEAEQNAPVATDTWDDEW
jgi:hypothetical protein